MTERILVVGATGLLGQALMRAARDAAPAACGLARSGADIVCDVTDDAALVRAIEAFRPGIVVNAAAMTHLATCEQDPAAAMRINARAVAVLANACRDAKARLVQISTDHYYTGDGETLHDETAPVRLVNEYARSKYAGEAFAMTCPGALVVRTNMTGWRGWDGQPTFFEWVVDALESRSPMVVFDDFLTSTMDAPTCARCVLELAAAGCAGIINVAAREAASKKTFVLETARALGIEPDWIETGSVAALDPPRAESLGLDVARAERELGRAMPDTRQVLQTLLAQRP